MTANKNTYKLIWVKKKKRVMWKHRHIMEGWLGRGLLPTEVVHHINGNKRDNSLENLVVMDKKEHSRLHGREESKLKGVNSLAYKVIPCVIYPNRHYCI